MANEWQTDSKSELSQRFDMAGTLRTDERTNERLSHPAEISLVPKRAGEIASEMFSHELVGVDAVSELCSCGVSSPTFLEHLGDVALEAMDAPSLPRRKSRARAVDMTSTRQLLADLAARQDELRAQADAEGLYGFTERVEWLTRMRTPDEHLAWERKWGYTPAVPIRRAQPTLEQMRVAEAWAERMAS